LTDTELTALLKQGDRQAFEYLVKNYQDRIFNACLGVLQSAEDAEDMAQEVFVEVYRSIGGFKGESKLSTWMYRIAMTKSLDHLRSKKRKKRFAFVSSLFKEDSNSPRFDPPDFMHPGVQLENKETAAWLFKAIDELPEQQKTAFTLHKVEGLSYQEISEIMETTIPSVESLMFRAKKNLKDSLATYYKNEF
jgi:RNA polymerase sigma factor (sigma-70 family)